MRPSQFNLRVPLATRGEEFLFNTLTDAQLLVTSRRCGAARSRGRGRVRRRRSARRAKRSKPSKRWRRTVFWSRAATPTSRRSTSILGGVKSDTAELNVTLLTTLQCNFACDYCFQGDHGDYNKFADKMTPRDRRAGRRRGSERELDRVQPRAARADVLRRRAAAESPGHVPASPSGMRRRRPVARRSTMCVNIITNGLLADARGGRSHAAVRV